MALPPGFIDELRDRLSLAQVVGRKVTWDQRKSNAAKGDYWAPCPFHEEKTASFHVDDAKGFYYCFGCQAKGDAFGFVRETENVGFMDAVEILAREAGMQMPARDPMAQAKADANQKLIAIMEHAVQFYRLQLRTGQGQAARDYLASRGLDEDTQARFEIGLAPPGRTSLISALASKGVSPEDADTAGLVIRPDDGGAPFDRFRNRIMFPIRDARGRAIAFGGRALDSEARAKYLNSPQTPLFDKGRTIYNLGPARESAGKTGGLIVAEGYMDVIALTRAGFGHAVAPLGTAVTSDQLQLIWRVADEPIFAMDGDKAGLRASLRIVDLALPALVAGKAIRFALLPEGLDPDDLIRTTGPAGMQAQLDAAVPMVDLLWKRLTEGRMFDSPERRAALDANLRSSLSVITDTAIRAHYEFALREKRRELFRPAARTPQSDRIPFRRDGRFGNRRPPAPRTNTRNSALVKASSDQAAAARVREATILYLLLQYPGLIEAYEPRIEDMTYRHADLDRIRLAILTVASQGQTKTSEVAAGVCEIIGSDPSRMLLTDGARLALGGQERCLSEPVAETTLSEAIGQQRAFAGAESELAESESAIGVSEDEGLTWRLAEAMQGKETASRGSPPSDENATDDEKTLSKQLDAFIRDEIWLKKPR